MLAGVAAADETVRYARYPALSPDNQTIAFTYQGDIWTTPAGGGTALRLAVHEAEDIQPQYSPDGRWILFSSRRFNNYDVYIIPAEGGPPRRLTFHSDDDIGTSWTAAGDSVLFTSSREGYSDIFIVSIEGGMPVKLTGYYYAREYNGRLSPDGRWLVYNNGSGGRRWWRRDMKASGNTDIYMADRTAAEFSSSRITEWEHHDVWPVLNYAANEIYFVSARGDWGQVYKKSLDGGEAAALTDFAGDGVQWLNGNPQGTMLVFEQGFHLWTLDPAEGTPQQVRITINSDERINLDITKAFKGDVDWFSLSPDEKKIAVIIHGEVFILPAENPEIGLQITATPAREKRVVWGSDSKTLYYASDRNGNFDIYSFDIPGETETQLTSDAANELKPLVSPDGNYLVFYRGLGKIIRHDLRNNTETVWIEGNFSDLGIEPTTEFAWSPDSRWLAYTMAGPTYETDIHVISLDGESHNLSRFVRWNFRPRFSDDGKYLYFTSTANDDYETYQIALQEEPFEFPESTIDSLFMDTLEDKEKDKKNDKDSIDITPVEIDFERIVQRREKAYRLAASSTHPVLTPDGKMYVFVSSLMGKPELWTIKVDGDDPDLTQLTHSGKSKSRLVISDDSKSVYYLDGDNIKKTELKGGKTESISFAAQLDISIPQLNRQKFEESWAMLNAYFYDSDFHGTDWGVVRDKYSPIVDHVRTEPEFINLLKEMMGELRASHLSAYSREPGTSNVYATGETGIEWDYDEIESSGNFRIAGIITDSPADLAGLAIGQYVLAINGQPLTPEKNLFELLEGTRDRRVELTIAVSPGKKGEMVYIKPAASLSDLTYEDWVQRNRDRVGELSGGRLAYLHIRSMSGTYLARFKEELVSIAEKKDGLIIDVRNNGGGNIAVHLLGILIKQPYFLRNFRDFPVTSENKMRSKALEKPMTLLINGLSASNSEIFAEGFRTLELGKIIGEPTAGAVIGTGSYTLIDGMRIRRPSWGAFTINMEDTDLVPRHPDIFVENLPDDFINGRDPQLVRAVEELMKELD